ncbi:MAG: hypothetical protein RL171_816, partial [Pseudomonadota bacterium]
MAISEQTNLSTQLDALDGKLLQAASFDASIQSWCEDACEVLKSECVGLFLANEDGVSISSKVTTGISTNLRIKLPISPKSLAGFVALTKKQLNIPDVGNSAALQRIHPELRFADAVDKSTGFRSAQMIISPIMAGNALLGVLEVINNKNGQPF